MTTHVISPEQAGLRLDAWLSKQDPTCSRARWQQLIKDGYVRVNGASQKANYTLRTDDKVETEIPEAAPVALVPEPIPLDVLVEDADMIAVNKPAGMVVHPAPGHSGGTLVNALLHHCKDLQGIGGERRPGIVHRLDKDTSGVIVCAKNEQSMAALTQQFKDRKTQKEYIALAWGVPNPRKGTIHTLINRSAGNRKKMTARTDTGREAITHYEIMETLGPTSLLRVRIETGRTHQIRVHLSHKGYPIVGDTQYGRARAQQLPHPARRQMLHAARLKIHHPATGVAMTLEAPLPDDMEDVIQALRAL